MIGIVFTMYAARFEERISFETANTNQPWTTVLRPNVYPLNAAQTG